MATAEAVTRELTEFVGKELLDGQTDGLNADTPLIEWGIIDSISLVTLIKFMASKFGVEAPVKGLSAKDFASIKSMTDYVLRLQQAQHK